MDTDHSASIVANVAETMLLETREDGDYLPDYKMRAIVCSLPLNPNEKQIELGERLLHQFIDLILISLHDSQI